MKKNETNDPKGLPDKHFSGFNKDHKQLLTAILFFLLIFFYMFLREFLTNVIALPAVPGGVYGKMLPPVLFALIYLAYTRGFQSAVFLALFLWVYCWAAEELSVHTGFPFGHYYYSDQLGYKLDVVPIMIGFNYMWVLVFPAFYISNLLAQGTFLEMGKGIKGLLFTAFVASIVTSGIDMVLDPMDATKMSEWVWTKNAYTGYYGIPYMNYLGYIIVMTPAFFIFGLIQRKFNAKPMGPVNLWIASIPLFFYFLIFLMYGAPAPSGVFLVGCFTMVFPLILSIDKLLKHFSTE
ncbi:MAG: carotenoid biosynthesis protein [Bacteroidota bacterium]